MDNPTMCTLGQMKFSGTTHTVMLGTRTPESSIQFAISFISAMLKPYSQYGHGGEELFRELLAFDSLYLDVRFG